MGLYSFLEHQITLFIFFCYWYILFFFFSLSYMSMSGYLYLLLSFTLTASTVQRNYDPTLHPFEAAREYKLALNAVKLERVFAKPFVSSLTHSDALSAMCRHPSQLSSVFTGTVEGEVRSGLGWPCVCVFPFVYLLLFCICISFPGEWSTTWFRVQWCMLSNIRNQITSFSFCSWCCGTSLKRSQSGLSRPTMAILGPL